MTADLLALGKSVCHELGDAVAERSRTASPLPPMEAVLSFCHLHRLTPLYAAALSRREQLPQDATVLLQRGKQDMLRQLKNDAVEANISTAFDKAGIRHTILKGSHTRSFYPVNLPRTSADIDWQIDKADAARADTVLTENGWTLKTAHRDERCYEKPPHSRLELRLSPEGFHDSQKRVVREMFEHAVAENDTRYHLTDSDAYVYAVLHLYKHFVFAGAGVRMFLDVYAIRTHGTLDKAYIDRTLQRLGIAPFAARVEDIAAVLFDGADSTAELDALIRFVFAGGAYGVSELQIALEPLNKDLTGDTRTKRLMRNYCFDLSSMKARYACLERTVLLYPFCVVHRVWHGLRHRRHVLKEASRDRRQTQTHTDDMKRILELASIL